MAKTIFTTHDIEHIAKLAQIPITQQSEEKLAKDFTSVLEIVDKLNAVDTLNVHEAHQVAGLKNVFREDVVDTSRMLSQDQALSNAHESHDGFFVVNQVIRQD